MKFDVHSKKNGSRVLGVTLLGCWGTLRWRNQANTITMKIGLVKTLNLSTDWTVRSSNQEPGPQNKFYSYTEYLFLNLIIDKKIRPNNIKT